MTKHEAVKEYLTPEVEMLAGDILRFNFSPEAADSFSVVTEYSDRVVKKFITGSERMAYGFAVIIVKEYSTSGDDLNLECMEFVQAFMDWIEEQNAAGEYPDFGEDCEIEKMEVLQNMPNLSGVNEEEALARYMVQCRITYVQKYD